MSWRSCRLGDVLTLQRGHDLPERLRVDGDVPVVSSSGITGYHNEAKAEAPGVVTGRYGTLGEVFYIERDYWPLNTALYVVDFKGNDPRFSAYFLKNLLKYYQSDKAAVPGVDRNVLHEMRVRVPTYTTQLKISAVLSGYDDLISNNCRRMELLEESVRILHREWFVHLRFPGHEHTRITEGVPDGWARTTLGELCDEVRESVSPDALQPDTPYIGLEHMPRRSISLSDWGKAEEVTSSKHRFTAGDIIFGKIRPYFHKVGVAFIDGIASADAIVIRPCEDKLRGLVLTTVSSDEFVAVTAQAMKEGAKMPRADWKQMQQYSCPVPPDGLLGSFESVIRHVTEQLGKLSLANQRLRGARDLLLPRLMNGAIVV
ncbi:type I restriction enzyme S subunit [Paraburkholderia atlantica]|uniref:restriction endonuclease subunit S n=1 Tax=Paraburkholderia atlantica TaxID=2654982 RepID=UPI003D1E6EBA